MADNNVEDNPPTASIEDIENAEHDERATTNSQNNNTPQEPTDEPKKNNENDDIVDKSKRSAKILLIFVNICTIICSIVLFVVGVMMTVKHAKIHEEWEAGHGLMNASIICVVISLVLAAVGSMGLVGAIRENRCLLIAFSVVLGFLIFVEIALLVTLLALAREQNLGSIANNKMTESMKRYDEEGYEGVTTVWDVVQTELKCCGVTNATDWFRSYSRRKNNSKRILPESCCATKPFEEAVNGQHQCEYGNSQHPHNTNGCLRALEESIKRNEGIIAAVIGVVVLGQIGLIIASVHLMKNTKKPNSCYPCY